ncbi:hypothetical protein EYF80_063196 [Liparis tanakae]|uniref:Uncharacterized protein n=1 Tax=Liparis tanakae TaxID=230148 RepID=A0A4Z2ED20_9TELE|nr:hypothetical protein EYF80_063196 [Liparis tanakae]
MWSRVETDVFTQNPRLSAAGGKRLQTHSEAHGEKPGSAPPPGNPEETSHWPIGSRREGMFQNENERRHQDAAAGTPHTGRSGLPLVPCSG